MNNNIEVNYSIDADETPCLYISRLEQMLTNDSYNIYTIEKLLNSVVDTEMKEIDSLKKDLSSASSILTSPNINLSDVFKLAKNLSTGFDSYAKKLKMLNQIGTIDLVGIDEDRRIELQDTITDHVLEFRRTMDGLTDSYKKFLTLGDSSFKNLDDSKRQIILDSVKNLIKTENVNTDVIQENKLIDILAGIAGGTVAFVKNVLIKHWLLIASAFGLNYITNNFLINCLLEFGTTLSNGITVAILSFIIFIGVCLSIYIYNHIYDFINRKENEKLSEKLDQINRSNKMKGKDYTMPSKDIDRNNVSITDTVTKDTFRGFNNSSSYNPDAETGGNPNLNVF